jgi:hypothetical protein
MQTSILEYLQMTTLALHRFRAEKLFDSSHAIILQLEVTL